MKKIEKKFSHNEKEICSLCNKEINTKNDLWTTILDLDKKNIKSFKFYHSGCMKDLLQAKGKIIHEAFANKLQEFTKRMLGNLKQSPEEIRENLNMLKA